MSKGSNRRPEDYERFCRNWEKAFGQPHAGAGGGTSEAMRTFKTGRREVGGEGGKVSETEIEGS